MKNFNWVKAIGFGVLVWGIMFVIVSLFTTMGWYSAFFSKIILVLIAGVVAYAFALNTRPYNLLQAFGYGLSWIIVGILLDILVSTQFESMVLFSWEYLFGYTLILLAPIFSVDISPELKSTSASVH